MKSAFSRPALGVFISSFCLSPVLASESLQLEEIVVTSSRVPVPLRQLGTSVSRLDAEEISERGHLSLSDVLRTLPGIGVSNSGGLGQATTLRIRGEEGFRTLVLVDGMDISDPTPPQVSPRVQHLTSAGIDSVEILRGPQGMMYGADAGGVVSVLTPRASDGFQSTVQVNGGRYGTQQAFAELAGEAGPVDFYLSGNRLESDGFNARLDDTSLRDDDGYENTTLHGRIAWNVGEEWRLQAVLRDVDAITEYDGCGWPTIHDCRGEFDQRSARVSMNYSGQRFGHEVAVQQSELDSGDFAAGALSFGAEGEISKLEYLGNIAINQNASIVFGIDHKNEEMASGADDLSREQTGVYAEYQGRYFDRLYLTAGLRQDDNDDFGKHNSYRVSTAYLIPMGENVLKLKASASDGFRAPSLYELAYNTGPWAYSPAADVQLKEEQSQGYDAGLEFFIDEHTQLEAVYFDQTIEDEIFFDSAFWSGYLQARGENESTGVELAAQHQSSELWSVSANFTYNDTETADGDPRVRRPKQLANARFALYPLADLSLHLNWRASRNARAVDGSKLDDYEVFDLGASYDLLSSLSLFARVENLLNEEYQEVVGYNTSGRAGYVGARFHF